MTQPAPANDPLTQELLHAAVREQRAIDLLGDEAPTWERPWPPNRHIPAAWLREVIAEAPHGVLRPRLQLRGVWVDGPLTLDHLNSEVELELTACWIDGDIDLTASSWPRLSVVQSIVEGRVIAQTANVQGQLVLNGSAVRTTQPRALDLDQAVVGGSVFATDLRVPRGSLNAPRLQVGGDLVLCGASFRAGSADTVRLERATIAGSIFADRNFHLEGEFQAIGLTIGSSLHLGSASLENGRGAVLDLSRARIGDGIYAVDGFVSEGKILAARATIVGDVNLRGAHLSNPEHTTLDFSRARVDGTVYASEGFESNGRITFQGAQIRGDVQLGGATLRHPGGTAINLDEATVHGRLDATRTATFDPLYAEGMLSARGVTVDHDILLDAVTVTACAAPAVSDDKAATTTDDDGPTTRETGIAVQLSAGLVSGRVSLVDARIEGQVLAEDLHIGKDLDLSRLCSPVAPPSGGDVLQTTLDLVRCKVDGRLVLQPSPEWWGSVNLQSSQIGLLVTRTEKCATAQRADLTADGLPRLASCSGWSLHGMEGLLAKDPSAATRWLSTPADLSTQPAHEMARVHDRQGSPKQARILRIDAAERVTRASGLGTRATRSIYGALVGYGYRPLRSAGWIMGALLAAVLITHFNPDAFVATSASARATVAAGAPAPTGCPTPQARLTAAAPRECLSPQQPPLDSIAYGFATVIPASSLGTPAWAPTSRGVALMLTVLKAAGWLLTALFLAGLTGILRKD